MDLVTHTGAFGIVYRASLNDWKDSRSGLVAVKTLKGESFLFCFKECIAFTKIYVAHQVYSALAM